MHSNKRSLSKAQSVLFSIRYLLYEKLTHRETHFVEYLRRFFYGFKETSISEDLIPFQELWFVQFDAETSAKSTSAYCNKAKPSAKPSVLESLEAV